MSRKSIESSAICSRSRTSGARFVTSSSGAMVRMMSLMASMISSRVMAGRTRVLGELVFEAAHDQRRVDAEHAEREVQDVLDAADRARLVRDEIAHFAGRIEMVDVDRGVHDAVLERRQIAGQLERAGGAHRVADEALRV